MSRRGPRRPVAPSIYRDDGGFGVVVKHRGQRLERRFPADTSIRDMVAWQVRQRALIDLDQPLDGRDAPLQADVDRYLALLPEGQTKRDTTVLLRHWTDAFGNRLRRDLTAPVLHAQLLTWRKAGASPQTCNHRRRALVTLWKTLDGPDAPNPASTCPKLPVPRPEPRGLPWPLIQRILGAMRPSATRTRLEVIATTGLAHAMLMRLQPEDLHLAGPRPYLVVRPRRKGAGAPARAIPITPDAVRALKAFRAANLFGPFSRHAMYKSFRLAARKAKAPAGVRPYDLRHSHAARLYAATRDLRAVSELLVHSSLATTSRYAAQAVTATAQAAVDALAGGTKGGTASQTPRTRRSRP